MVKSGLRICGCADVEIYKVELNFIFRLRVSVRVRVGVRVSISIYLIDVIKLRIGSVLTNNIRKSAVRFLPIADIVASDTLSRFRRELKRLLLFVRRAVSISQRLLVRRCSDWSRLP